MARARLRNGIGLAVAGTALIGATVTALPAQAGAAQTAPAKVRARVCAVVKKGAANSNAVSSEMTEAIDRGNWAKLKKELVAGYRKEASGAKSEIALLKGSSPALEADGLIVIGFVKKVPETIASSSSATAFETSLETLEEQPKVKEALNAVTAYLGTSHCTTSSSK